MWLLRYRHQGRHDTLICMYSRARPPRLTPCPDAHPRTRLGSNTACYTPGRKRFFQILVRRPVNRSTTHTISHDCVARLLYFKYCPHVLTCKELPGIPLQVTPSYLVAKTFPPPPPSCPLFCLAVPSYRTAVCDEEVPEYPGQGQPSQSESCPRLRC